MMPNPVISTKQLAEIISDPDTVVLDGSWYLPGQNRNACAEFQSCHIPGARFFDIDKIADCTTDLPHMVPREDLFSMEVESLGITNHSRIIVYDGAGLFSVARVWWLFRLFGHANVFILDGGLPMWIQEGYSVTAEKTAIRVGSFKAFLHPSKIALMNDVLENCQTKQALVLDARPRARFNGQAPEPRPGLPSGHMPGAISLPFTELLTNGRLKQEHELTDIFSALGVNRKTPVITSCGSGVTASIITLALFRCGCGLQQLYDGSWTEWASAAENPISTTEVSLTA